MPKDLNPDPSAATKKEVQQEEPLPERRLIDKHFFMRLLGVKERKFDEMDAAGLFNPPKFIGPRTRRWIYPDDFDAVLITLAAAKKGDEPATLAAGRRRRIESIKSGPAAGMAA